MEKKQIVTVYQDVKNILYDVRNKAYITGNSRKASGAANYEAGSKMQASEDTEEDDQLKRSLTTYFTGLKSKLGEYLDEDTTTTNNLITQIIEDEEILQLAFRLPTNYNNASADALGAGIHAYLVDMVLADWFTITNPQDVKSYIDHAAVLLEDVKAALYKRSRPTRPGRPMFPELKEETPSNP
ncbi:hypothetical protein [Muribaculum intestinale]|uniref:hypothetical protein n=1 Tax=Muribaculum intestinale TaxID=1796646 RepID=UPI0024328408|nr:hypothetical protein [Muribaculum intestinale]